MDFPGLEELENEGSTNAKTNSGVKSQLSDELIDAKAREPFEEYMIKKDRVLTKAKRISSQNLLVDAPVNLVFWKIYKPAFFKLAGSDENGFSMNSDQEMFI
jgi:hypothetical protein